MQRERVWRFFGQRFNTSYICPSFKSGYIGISVWAALSTRERTPLVLIDGTFNREKYEAILEAHVVLFFVQHYESTEDMVYQQDNCGPHRAKSIGAYKEAKSINLMK